MHDLYVSRRSNRTTAIAVGAALILFGGAACSDDGGNTAAVDAGSPDADLSESGHIIFVNPNPTMFTMGTVNDSFANVTTMFARSVMTTGLPAAEAAAWTEAMTCFRAMLEPYDVRVVEEDPGDIDHIELAISAAPSDVGLDSFVSSFVPTSCEPLPRGIGMVFAGSFSAATRCNLLGWSVGHLAGLENLYNCPDVNTYLDGCGPKSFVDEDSLCGEYEARDCNCGGTTQNSHQRMLEVYGARP